MQCPIVRSQANPGDAHSQGICHTTHLLKPLDLHVISIHSGSSLGVEHGTSLTDGHGLVVLHSKHVVEVWNWGQVTAGPAVVANDLLCELAVLWQGVGSPGVCLQEGHEPQVSINALSQLDDGLACPCRAYAAAAAAAAAAAKSSAQAGSADLVII